MEPGAVQRKAPHWSASARLVAYRDAKASELHMGQTGCSPAGIRIMLRKGLPISIRIDAVPIKAAILLKQEALSAGGDAAYSRDVAALSLEMTDVVLLLSERQLARLVPKLRLQPFGLKRLAEALEAMDDRRLFRRPADFRGRVLDFGSRTFVMGILNITPDSFSDGGMYLDQGAAFDHALRMLDEGADIIDIGGESTRPGSAPMGAEEEMERVLGVVRRLASRTGAIISVDTMKPEVAEACLDGGAHIVNDVGALSSDGRIARLAARYGAGLVLMHMRGTPSDMMQHTVYDDVVKDVAAELLESASLAEGSGAGADSIVLDPGFGFSKTAEQNVELLSRLREFAGLGYPLLAGLSRKSTIGRLTGVQDAKARMPGSIAAMTAAVLGGADIVRVHDVAESVQAAKVADALRV